jgi:hypothetical protein
MLEGLSRHKVRPYLNNNQCKGAGVGGGTIGRTQAYQVQGSEFKHSNTKNKSMIRNDICEGDKENGADLKNLGKQYFHWITVSTKDKRTAHVLVL